MNIAKLLSFFCIIAPLVLGGTQIDEQMPKYINEADVSEDGIPAGISADGTFAFGTYLKDNWRWMIKDLHLIAPSYRQQSVIVASTIFFSPSEYLDFIEALWDELNSGGAVLPDIAKRTVLSPGVVRYGVLELNNDHRKVRRICQFARTIFPEDKALLSHVEDITSGLAKKQAQNYLSQNRKKIPKPIADMRQTEKTVIQASFDSHNGTLPKAANTKQSNQRLSHSRWQSVAASVFLLILVLGTIMVVLRKKR